MRIDFEIFLRTIKVLHDLAAAYPSDLISVTKSSLYDLRSTDKGTSLWYSLTKSYKTLGDGAFMFAAPKLCNALPLVIRSTTSLSSFEGKVKYFLFRKATVKRIRTFLNFLNFFEFFI